MKNIWDAIDKIRHDLERGKKWCEICQIRKEMDIEKHDLCHLISGIKRIEVALLNLVEALEKIENEEKGSVS